MSERELQFRRGDVLTIICVVAAAVILAAGWWMRFRGAEAPVAQIYQNGTLVREVPLTRDAEYAVTGDYTNTITVSDGSISVSHSDCPGSDCVRMGSVRAAGSSIVCLPNKMEIRLTGESAIDAAVG